MTKKTTSKEFKNISGNVSFNMIPPRAISKFYSNMSNLNYVEFVILIERNSGVILMSSKISMHMSKSIN